MDLRTRKNFDSDFPNVNLENTPLKKFLDSWLEKLQNQISVKFLQKKKNQLHTLRTITIFEDLNNLEMWEFYATDWNFKVDTEDWRTCEVEKFSSQFSRHSNFPTWTQKKFQVFLVEKFW